MCLEDLRLGRGRFLKRPTVSTQNTSVTMPADPTRVAVIVSLILTNYYDSATSIFVFDSAIIRFSASESDPDSLLIGAGTSVFVMRIEDYGECVSGPITISMNNNSGFGQITLAAICTAVNAPPLDTYKP